MATLIKSTEDIKSYVSINNSVTFENIQPYVNQAERKFIVSIIGEILYNAWAATKPTGTELKAYKLFQEASANLAWFLYLPLAQLSVTDEAILVESAEYTKPAEWWQIRDLRRSVVDAGFNAIDEALKIMEANVEDFDPWEATEGYTIFSELLVKRTDTFNRWFNISNSRRTFLALKPYLLEVHHQYIAPLLNTATLTTIAAAAEAIHKEVLDVLQAAMVNFTVAKIATTGVFDITPSGIYQRLDDFQGYKTNPLDPTQLNNLYQDRLVAAQQHLKKAITLIEANPSEFTDYQPKATVDFVQPSNTKSIVSF
ncbi:hypothetical protein CL622_07030 [archaeon]|nr:hypothetical protein [archaeon]